jgi:RimJ/RimL family protein N-acetyltransferase
MAVTSKLELNRGDFFPRLFANESLIISRLSATSFRFARFLWENIDANADEDRSGWSSAQWQHYLTDPRCEFFAVYCDDEPAGCCEIVRETKLMRAKGGSVRIKAFGLFPEFSGEGLGSSLLTRMIEKSFATGADRVILRTGQELRPEIRTMFRNQGFQILTTEK